MLNLGNLSAIQSRNSCSSSCLSSLSFTAKHTSCPYASSSMAKLLHSFCYNLVLRNHIVQLNRRHLLATFVNHLLRAPSKEGIALLIKLSLISRPEETIRGRRLVRSRVVRISCIDVGAADGIIALLLVQNANFDSVRCFTYKSGLWLAWRQWVRLGNTLCRVLLGVGFEWSFELLPLQLVLHDHLIALCVILHDPGPQNSIPPPDLLDGFLCSGKLRSFLTSNTENTKAI